MLRQHKYKLHTGTPTFECNVCNKKFFYAAELREHSQLHASESCDFLFVTGKYKVMILGYVCLWYYVILYLQV